VIERSPVQLPAVPMPGSLGELSLPSRVPAFLAGVGWVAFPRVG